MIRNALSDCSMKLTNTFSWSLSRYNLFNFCERAYYFHYYGSWNGWDKHATPEAKNAFRLKHLTTKELWLNTILKKALHETVNNGPKDLPSKIFVQNSKKILSLDIRSLYAKEWQDDPKKVCIKEIYYNEVDLNAAISWIKDNLNNKVEMLQHSKLFSELSKLPYSAFATTNQPLSFTLDNIPVWISPDLIWDFQGKKHFLNLDNSSNWPFKAGLNVLYAAQKWKYPTKKIICHTMFFDNSQTNQTSQTPPTKHNCFSVYAVRSPKEIKNIIADSSKEMQSRLTFNKKAYIKNFSKTNDSEKCKICKFNRKSHRTLF